LAASRHFLSHVGLRFLRSSAPNTHSMRRQ
jgi:hypothetical protein